MPGTIRVLLMAADPRQGQAGLRLDHEIRGAVEAARAGDAPNRLEIVAELAVRPRDLGHALLRHSPQVVHFAGHGSAGKGILLDGGEQVPAAELAALFTPFREVRVVVLNACETFPVAQALSEVVDYVVSMETRVGDTAAVEFAGEFYAALAFGRSVPFAFELAKESMRARFDRDYGDGYGYPRLLVRGGADDRPVEGSSAPGQGRAAGGTGAQEVDISGARARRKAELLNEDDGPGATRRQAIRVTGSAFDGDLIVGNRRKR